MPLLLILIRTMRMFRPRYGFGKATAGKLFRLERGFAMRRDWLLLIAMSVFCALFVLRVLAQLLQFIYPVDWIPGFEAWHSGVVPYPGLLAGQLVLVGWMSFVLNKVRNRTIRARRWKYRTCLIFGSAYFAFMAFRWIAGMTFLAANPWFAKTLPAFFHLAIAGFILLLGLHISGRQRNRKIFVSSARF